MIASPLVRARRRARASHALTVVLVTVAALWSSWPLLNPRGDTAAARPTTTARTTAAPPIEATRKREPLPPEALTVTLNDELFPPPPAPPAPAPEPQPPDPRAALVGVITRDGERIAYIRDDASAQTGAYRVGDRLPSGALLSSIEPGIAELSMDGFELSLEIDR